MLGLRHYKGVAIDLWQGDITSFSCDAIVNAANESLLGGGGVDGAIHKVGGPSLLKECQEIGHCPRGGSVVTSAGNLPCEHVIHTVGPVWKGGDSGEEDLLQSAIKNSLGIAGQKKLRHVAFSAISTGVYGYPIEKAAKVFMGSFRNFIDESLDDSYPRRLTVVLFSGKAHDVFQSALFANFSEVE